MNKEERQKAAAEMVQAIPAAPDGSIYHQNFPAFFQRFSQLVDEFEEHRKNLTRLIDGGEDRGVLIKRLRVDLDIQGETISTIKREMPTKEQLDDLKEMLAERGFRKRLWKNVIFFSGWAVFWVGLIFTYRSQIGAAWKGAFP